MTRAYYIVWGADLITTDQWREASPVIRGAVFTLWTLGSVKSDESRWPCRERVEATLRAERFHRVEELTGKLIETGWLDLQPDGQLVVHNWTIWQPKLPKSGAERTRDWRGRKVTDATPSGGNVTPRDAGNETSSLVTGRVNVTLGEERIGEKNTREIRAGARNADRFDGPSDRLEQVLGRWGVMGVPLGPRLKAKLDSLVEEHGEAKVLVLLEQVRGTGAREAGQFVHGAGNALRPVPQLVPSRNGKAPIVSPSWTGDENDNARFLDDSEAIR